jgi:adenosylcobinamide-GDP ribazoletransferase
MFGKPRVTAPVDLSRTVGSSNDAPDDPADGGVDRAAAPRWLERLWHDVCAATAFLTILPLAGALPPPTMSPPSATPPTPSAANPVATAGDGMASPGIAADAAPAPVDAAARASAFLARGAGLFPLIGVFVGTAAALGLLASFHVGLHPLACALVALATAALVTGALHEDGLADFFDGLGAGRSRDNRLRAMDDSHLGSCGALALIFAVGVRAAMLSGLFSPDTAALAVICGAAVSRAVLPGLMRWLPPAKGDGLAAAAGRPEPTQVALAVLIALAAALLCVGFWGAVSALAAALVAAAIVGLAAQRLLGGKTGDVLGAAQVIAEIAVIAAIAATDS